jgi:hypothetical protein
MASRNEVSGIPKNATSIFPEETVLGIQEVTVTPARTIATSAGFNISNFKYNALTSGLLRPTLYDVLIKNHTKAKEYSFLTENVALPSVGMDTQAIRRYGYGPLEYVPFRPVFQDSVRMNLITQSSKSNVLSDFLIEISNISPFMNYSTMRSQIASSGQSVSLFPYEVQYKKDIEFDISVMIYNEKKEDVMTYTFKNCYAKQIGGIDLGWGNTDQYVRTSVDFAFTDFGIDSAPNSKMNDLLNQSIEATLAATLPAQIENLSNFVPDGIRTQTNSAAPTGEPTNPYTTTLT